MIVQDLLDYFETIAPLHLQESYDNAGLIVGDVNAKILGTVTCLDSTEEVIQEAIEIGANVVVAHHPIIFNGLKQLTGSNYIQRVIQLAIKNDIAIIAMHTNLDNVFQNGVNQKIANKLNLQGLEILKPKTEEEIYSGSGIIGNLSKPMKTTEFLEFLKESMHVKCIKYTKIINDLVQSIAICGGSGGFLLNDAIRKEADVFITADYKYHEFFDSDNQIMIADIGHYESEQFTIDLLNELISKKFITFAARITKVNTNPVNYL